jgi:hypothetical protein
LLAYLQPGEKFIVDTGMHIIGIEAVLSHVEDDHEQVIACYTKMLNKTERNFCVTQRELLVIVRRLEHFHKYPYGQEFHLYMTTPNSPGS